MFRLHKFVKKLSNLWKLKKKKENCLNWWKLHKFAKITQFVAREETPLFITVSDNKEQRFKTEYTTQVHQAVGGGAQVAGGGGTSRQSLIYLVVIFNLCSVINLYFIIYIYIIWGISYKCSVINVFIIIYSYTGCFFNCPSLPLPKKLKFVKPRLGESTLT